jgi:hypothetical protein
VHLIKLKNWKNIIRLICFILAYVLEMNEMFNYLVEKILSSITKKKIFKIFTMIILNSFHTLYEFLNLLIMTKCWNVMWVRLWRNWRNVIVFGLHIGCSISNTANLWWNLIVVMDVVWSMTKSVKKLAQRHSV